MTNRWANAAEEQKQKFKEAVSKGKKKMWENLSEKERAKHIKQLKINAEKGRKNKSEEAKKKFKEKMSKIVKERWENDEYRKHMSNMVSQQMKRQREGYSEEEKEAKRQDIKDKAKVYRESLTKKEREEYTDKMYQGRVAAAKEREKRGEIKRPCQYPQCILGAKADSNVNAKREELFLNNGLSLKKEFPVGNYLYDFKINNTLIEVNPYAWHNSTRVPSYPGAKPKDKLYHYNKTKYAIDNGYNIINIRDRMNSDEVISLLNKQTYINKEPTLHRYNPKTKEHIIDDGFLVVDMLDKGFIEIRDGGEFYFINNKGDG